MDQNLPLLVDCDQCVVRSAAACGDCFVSVMLGAPPDGIEIEPDEQAALDVLVDCGLLPPLRHVIAVTAPVARQRGKLNSVPDSA